MYFVTLRTTVKRYPNIVFFYKYNVIQNSSDIQSRWLLINQYKTFIWCDYILCNRQPFWTKINVNFKEFFIENVQCLVVSFLIGILNLTFWNSPKLILIYNEFYWKSRLLFLQNRSLPRTHLSCLFSFFRKSFIFSFEYDQSSLLQSILKFTRLFFRGKD